MNKLKTINLTKGKQAIVDSEDYEMLIQFNWHYNTEGYAMRTVNHSGKLSMHRQLMGDKQGHVIDHVDGNGLNNSRTNLRHATHKENMRNRKLQTNNTSGFKGVYWKPIKQKWEAAIRISNQYKYLGAFISKVEAARAYNRAAIEHYGIFAKLNEIKE